MTRRLSGAALYAKVISECRKMLARDYGLPMDLYTCVMEDPYWLGSDMQPILTVTFTHKDTGCTVLVTEIYPYDDGTLAQYGSNYGHLAY